MSRGVKFIDHEDCKFLNIETGSADPDQRAVEEAVKSDHGLRCHLLLRYGIIALTIQLFNFMNVIVPQWVHSVNMMCLLGNLRVPFYRI